MYFLLPDVKRAQSVYQELLLARVESARVHFLAKEGTSLGELPEASVLQKSDAVHGAFLGLAAGGLTGIVAGVIVLLFPPAGLPTGFSIVLAMAVIGAIMGVWMAGTIGASTPSTHLEAFADEIARGKVLLMVDVPRERAEEISRLIRQQHPEANARGAESTVSSPFS